MNKFLQYINDTLLSLDIPPIATKEDTLYLKKLRRQSSKSNTKHQK
ncbi:MAG: hypothetical protein ACI9NI_000807 [Olleya marilimosa]|jgi:hypothetical protein|uniref:Uncharacterized protein n=1 Tax=Olleya marilimosa TaxID=272164 RepID=A0ABR8LW83_9FLAO|nr:hypothetical protein [Olleya marilimosa]MBD3864100.1 hypothetical protein [Olleya marilimosa]MBD3891558.1 hypothetical protein [Olleya marilimosa]